MTWLTTILGTVTSFFSGKLRLFLEYALIAIILAMGGFLVALWGHAGRLSNQAQRDAAAIQALEQRMATEEGITQGHQQAIENLRNLRLEDAKALGGLIDDYKVLRAASDKVRRALANLEDSNEEVKNYLDWPIPDDLKCMLNNTCAKTGTRDNRQNNTSD